MISIDSNLQVTQGNIFGRQLVWKSANLHRQQKYIHLQEMWGFFFRGGQSKQKYYVVPKIYLLSNHPPDPWTKIQSQLNVWSLSKIPNSTRRRRTDLFDCQFFSLYIIRLDDLHFFTTTVDADFIQVCFDFDQKKCK